jgi:hypothetical protein
MSSKATIAFQDRDPDQNHDRDPDGDQDQDRDCDQDRDLDRDIDRDKTKGRTIIPEVMQILWHALAHPREVVRIIFQKLQRGTNSRNQWGNQGGELDFDPFDTF